MGNLCRLITILLDTMDENEDQQYLEKGCPKFSDIIFSKKDKELIRQIRAKGAEEDD